MNFGTTQEFFDTRPKSIPSRKEKDAHMLLPELHPLTHEAADFINKYVEKLSPKTEDFVAYWKEQLTNKDPIYLEDLKWFNSEKIGWSDDRWRS